MKSAGVILATLLLIAAPAVAHDLPAQLPEPASVPEAWNVISESAANVDKLMEQGLLRDVTFQLANMATALRMLEAHAADDRDPQKLRQLADNVIAGAADLIVTVRQQSESVLHVKTKWRACRETLAELQLHYPAEVVSAGVYVCPMHPLDRHLRADEKCSACGMSLVRRHLPASSVYEKPGEPTMKLAVIASPLIVGQPANVRIRLTRNDASPVTLADLVEVHTRKIHLLINDAGLNDYHHEHPEPTATPGEYAFTFTPRKPGPYRVWADVVPADSGVQEYVIADIPADTMPRPIDDRAMKLTSVVDGRTFTLALNTADQPIHAGQTVVGTITIAERDGSPCTTLQPVMGAFAHIVGFSEDQKAVLHIHPYGAEPKRPDDRGGPAFAFKLYVPTPGFLRLYAQVQMDGVPQFAPFNLTIAPSEKPAQ